MSKRKSKLKALKKSASREPGGAGRIPIFSGTLARFSPTSWQILALILAGGFILQASAITAPFFADDYYFLDQVRYRSLYQTIRSPDPLGGYFRPVGRQLYFWLNAHISGQSPLFFHSVNMCLFLLSLGLLFFIAKRLSGQLAAVVTTGIFAVHYSVDIPVHWASGGQDLLALVGALVSLQLFLVRRPWLAAGTFFLALLCKESIALTPLVAIYMGYSDTGSWKKATGRALPLLLAVIPWVVMWLSFGSRQISPDVKLTFSAAGFVGTLVQLSRVSFGLEWVTGNFGSQWAVFPPFVALLPIATALFLIPLSDRKSRVSPAPGLAWAALGVLPVAPVAAVWSAYYYVFAFAGVALALGAWVTRFPRWVAFALIVIVAWTSQGARQVNEFATRPGVWSAQSHMNDSWFSRGAGIVESHLRDLKHAHPTVPSHSTFFFFNIAGFTSWLTLDGAQVRWAYEDSTLRAYYLTEFSLEKARRGPSFYFKEEGGRLVELPADMALPEVATRAILNDSLNIAREALLLQLDLKPGDKSASYFLAFVEWARDDTESAIHLLSQAGVSPRFGPTPELSDAEVLAQSGKTDRAIGLVLEAISRHGLDPEAHGLLSDLFIAGEVYQSVTFISAFAALALDPQDPDVWRRWGMIQYYLKLYPQAETSLERYFKLGGVRVKGDTQAREVLDSIPGLLPGSHQAQKDIPLDPAVKTNK